MTIAEASRKYDISADTLRYYERIGLIPPVPRTRGGVRDYGEKSCGWIQLMKCMRAAGVQIEALIEYVDLFPRCKRADKVCLVNPNNLAHSDNECFSP